MVLGFDWLLGQGFRGQKKSIGCFCWDYRRLGREIGEGFRGIL